MNIESIGKPAFLTDIKYGDFFYAQLGDKVRPCIKAFIVENDAEVLEYIVSFTPSEREAGDLPRLFENKTIKGSFAYRVSSPAFRNLVSAGSLLLKTEYWPKAGIVIESSEATYLTVKTGRMPHKLMYMNVSTGELITSPPKAPFAFITNWKIVIDQSEVEQVLVSFPSSRARSPATVL